jgi:hypothetical protein
MIVVFGTRLMGKCDVVPGMFHVATRFGHFCFLPLIPMGSYAVVGKSGNRIHRDDVGALIPLSLKSIVLAWARVVLIVMASGATLWAIAAIADGKPHESPVGLTVSALVHWGLLGLLYSPIVMRASFSRAMKLAGELRLTGAEVASIEQIYGKSAGQGFAVQPAASPTKTGMTPPRAKPATPSPVASRPKVASDGGAIPLEPPGRPVVKNRPNQAAPPRRS